MELMVLGEWDVGTCSIVYTLGVMDNGDLMALPAVKGIDRGWEVVAPRSMLGQQVLVAALRRIERMRWGDED